LAAGEVPFSQIVSAVFGRWFAGLPSEARRVRRRTAKIDAKFSLAGTSPPDMGAMPPDLAAQKAALPTASAVCRHA
jgi:hypothetical protein